jgi:hypothetical protein
MRTPVAVESQLPCPAVPKGRLLLLLPGRNFLRKLQVLLSTSQQTSPHMMLTRASCVVADKHLHLHQGRAAWQGKGYGIAPVSIASLQYGPAESAAPDRKAAGVNAFIPCLEGC